MKSETFTYASMRTTIPHLIIDIDPIVIQNMGMIPIPPQSIPSPLLTSLKVLIRSSMVMAIIGNFIFTLRTRMATSSQKQIPPTRLLPAMTSEQRVGCLQMSCIIYILGEPETTSRWGLGFGYKISH
jgi:hypothetical protein